MFVLCCLIVCVLFGGGLLCSVMVCYCWYGMVCCVMFGLGCVVLRVGFVLCCFVLFRFVRCLVYVMCELWFVRFVYVRVVWWG